MGKRGPKTTPQSVARPGPVPAPPDWMTDENALAIWEQYQGPLNALGLLETLDAVAFAMLCEAIVAYRDARSQLSPDDLVQSVGEAGALQQHPLVSIIRQQSKAVREFLAEFGMTPASRTALTGSTSAIPAGDQTDPFERVLSEFAEPEPPATPPTKRKAAKKPARPAKRKPRTTGRK